MDNLMKAILQEEEWFRELWERAADWEEFYELAERIDEILREKYGEEGLYGGFLNKRKFEEGWQYRDVLCDDYDTALWEEWYSLLFGWW